MATKKSSPPARKKAAKKAPAKSASKASVSAAAPKVTQAQAVTAVISPALQEVIGRAITDTSFRDQLFSNRAEAVKGFKLTKIDQQCLDQIKREQIENQAQVFAKKLNVYVFVQITIHF
jgi:hypothetical protein